MLFRQLTAGNHAGKAGKQLEEPWDGGERVNGPRLARPWEAAPELSPTGEKSLQGTEDSYHP